MVAMRYARAVQKVRELAAACESVKDWPPEEPFLVEAYVFGELLEGSDPLEYVEIAIVVNLPAVEVPWETHPHGTQWLADQLRLSKGGFAYWWRSNRIPIWNHHIREPARFWSHDGPDEAVLRALAERRFEEIPRLTPERQAEHDRQAEDLAAALNHLRTVHSSYWDREWRREHRGSGRYPENHLWEAVQGYLDLLDVAAPR